MASVKSIETVRSFMGCLPETHTRVQSIDTGTDTDDGDVDDDLLRLHALRGEWSTVISLVEQLRQRAVVRVSMMHHHSEQLSPQYKDINPTHSSSALETSNSKDTDSSTLLSARALASSHIDILSAEMPYTLVQVTAYMKMRQYAAAKRVIDSLGDLSDTSYVHPTTHESIVPFSLRFLAAVLPSYMDFPMESIGALYALLDECERAEKLLHDASDVCRLHQEKLTWNSRISRVRRALIYLHFSRGQYELAMTLFGKLIAMYECADRDTREPTHTLATQNDLASSPLMRFCSVLRLQQFACIALQSSHFALARGLFQRIDTVARTTLHTLRRSKGSDGYTAWMHVQQLNEAFMLAFLGRFDQAARRLRDLCATPLASDASGANRNTAPPSTLALSSLPTASHELEPCVAGNRDSGMMCRRSTITDGHMNEGNENVVTSDAGHNEIESDAAYMALFSRYLRACAQTSHLACLPYTTMYGAAPTRVMSDMETIMEQYLKDNPHFLLSSEAFLGNCVRLYTLAGERQEKLARLSAFMDVFSCDASSCPALDKIM